MRRLASPILTRLNVPFWLDNGWWLGHPILANTRNTLTTSKIPDRTWQKQKTSTGFLTFTLNTSPSGDSAPFDSLILSYGQSNHWSDFVPCQLGVGGSHPIGSPLPWTVNLIHHHRKPPLQSHPGEFRVKPPHRCRLVAEAGRLANTAWCCCSNAKGRT